MPLKIAQLSLSPNSKSNQANDIFVAQPDSIKESLAGKLFIIIEIDENSSTSIKIINYLIDNINHNYYQNEKILLRERISTLKVEHIFESVLAKSNRLFSEFLEKEKINLKPNNINITVGVIHDNELHFANSGKNKVFLVYENNKQNKYANDDQKHKIIDITKHSGGDNEVLKISKIFSNVISGPIPSNGIIIISNEALPEYVSNSKLCEISTTLPPIGAVEQIKNTLSSINSYVSFQGLIIKNSQAGNTKENYTPIRKSTEESIVSLNRTEESTENLLTPSGVVNLKRLTQIKNLFKGKNKNAKLGNQLNLKDKIIVKKKSSNILKQVASFSKNIFSFLGRFLSQFLSFIFSLKSITNTKDNFQSFIKKRTDKTFQRIAQLSKKSKVLLVLGVFLIIFFTYNISVMQTNKDVEEKANNYNEIAQLIEQKQNQAEANLIYSNENGAKKLFDEIKSLMDTLPQDTEEQKNRYNDFNQKFQEHMEKIRRLFRLPTEEIADFSNLNNEAKPENIAFNAETNKLYSADSSQKSIYILDTQDNIVTTITDLSLPVLSLEAPVINNKEQIYYINGNSIIEFSLVDEQFEILELGPGNTNPVNIDIYNDRLYALDNQEGSIFRYNRLTNSFGSPYNWLSVQANLNDAVDISIDGHIYVLMNNGEVLKFLRGEEIDFSLESIDPPLQDPKKIFVSPEGEYLYILDSKDNRLVVYDKNGQFIIQYTSDDFNDLRDFQINETNGNMYFLNGTKVLKMESQHKE